MVAPTPQDEKKRLDALLKFGLLDSPPEEAFNELVQLAAATCQMPIALLTLIDSERQWFKASIGTSLIETETPRDIAFCSYTILGDELMEVPDALQDERFQFNPRVTGAPHIRFYAGVPLRTSDGYALGSLCVLDVQPRQLTNEQRFALKVLGRQVIGKIEAEYKSRQLRELQRQLEEKQPKILDRIRYGSLVQKSLMPRRKILQDYFQESFVLWKPRDIIANNFCFLHEEGDNLFLGVIDCMDQCFINPFFGTLVNGYLQEIIRQKVIKPAKILKELHKRLMRLWPNNPKLSQRGISMALCRINKNQQILYFSGADQLLGIFENKQGFRILKGSKVRPGKKEQEEPSFRYAEQSVSLTEGMTLFLLGQDVQKLLAAGGREGIRQVLREFSLLQEEPLNHQATLLLQTLNELNSKVHQKELDLLVVGFRVARE